MIMKTIKLAIATLILACGFQAASAQVHIGVSIGTPPPVYVAPPPVYHEVYYERPVVYRHVIVRPAYRPVYYHRAYYDRPHYRHAYYHHPRYYRHY